MPTTDYFQIVAVLMLKNEWSSAAIRLALQGIFGQQQTGVERELPTIIKAFPDPPLLADLVRQLRSNETIALALKMRATQKRLKSIWLPHGLGWVDWRLPRIETAAQLASQLGIPPRTLTWLTALRFPADKRPRHYRYRWVPKSGCQRHRLIESPKSILKTTQRFLLQDFLNPVPVHSAAHGFCPHRSVLTFVRPHLQQDVCLRMDLKDFFPSIGGGRILGLFRMMGLPVDVAKLLAGLTTTQTPIDIIEPARPEGCRGAFRLSRLYLRPHLPQGAPTSPAIANLVAFQMDKRLSGLAHSCGVRYTRYADDLLFSGDSGFRSKLKRFAATVGAIAIEEGFEVNYRKTRILPIAQRQRVAGLILNGRGNLERKEFESLKATLFNCIRFGPDSQNRDQHPAFKQHLLGRINWMAQANPARGEKLIKLFEQINF